MNPQRISIGRAINIGLIWVNGPVMLFLIGTPALALVGVPMLLKVLDVPTTSASAFVAGATVPSLVIGFVGAWTWWSVTIPKWRLWAYERVDDIPALKARAVAVGLTWPDGHVFEKTEIKSEEHRRRERELDPTQRPLQ